MTDPFEVSRRKIARAKKHIADFEEQACVFLKTNPREMIMEPDPQEAQHVIHKVRFKSGLPASLIDAAADSVHNLRSSLDNAVYGIAIAAGKTTPQHAAFPFAGSAVEFENNLKGRCKDIPKEVHPLLRGFKPYKGGDDLLWALNQISNTDKHRLLSVGLNSVLGDVTLVGGVVKMPINPPWDHLKNEIEIGTFVRGSGVQYKAQIALFIGFDEVDVVVGEPALRVLDYCVSVVERILLALEAEARRLGFVK